MGTLHGGIKSAHLFQPMQLGEFKLGNRVKCVACSVAKRRNQFGPCCTVSGWRLCNRKSPIINPKS
jgi:hypothetical protein